MDKEKILKLINQIEEATAKLKLEVGIPTRKDVKKRMIKPKRGKAEDFKGITGGVRLLISRGFFKNKKRTFGEIRKDLNKNGYYSSLQAIQTALDQLSGPKGPLVKIKERGKNYYVERK